MGTSRKIRTWLTRKTGSLRQIGTKFQQGPSQQKLRQSLPRIFAVQPPNRFPKGQIGDLNIDLVRSNIKTGDTPTDVQNRIERKFGEGTMSRETVVKILDILEERGEIKVKHPEHSV